MNPMVSEDLARPLKGAPDDFSQIMKAAPRLQCAGFQPRHIEEVGDEPVEPFCLVLNRRDQVALRGFVEHIAEILESSDGSDDGCERGFEIMGDRGQQRRAQPVRLSSFLRLSRISSRTTHVSHQPVRQLIQGEIQRVEH